MRRFGQSRSRCISEGRPAPSARDAYRHMIGVVIVAHGGLAGEFRAALEHVVGRQERLEDFSIGPEDDVEQRRVELIEAVRRVDGGRGVVTILDEEKVLEDA